VRAPAQSLAKNGLTYELPSVALMIANDAPVARTERQLIAAPSGCW
jgi:hypothetical protein